jgi:hypothetical protein
MRGYRKFNMIEFRTNNFKAHLLRLYRPSCVPPHRFGTCRATVATTAGRESQILRARYKIYHVRVIDGLLGQSITNRQFLRRPTSTSPRAEKHGLPRVSNLRHPPCYDRCRTILQYSGKLLSVVSPILVEKDRSLFDIPGKV